LFQELFLLELLKAAYVPTSNWQQGDQIGRRFTNWAIVCFGKGFGKLLKKLTILDWVFYVKFYVLILTKNSSGHPAWQQQNCFTAL
jgi:hypothetical protein